MKKKNMEKPYDGKKSAWVPDKANGGYLEGLCENDMKVADWEAVGKKVNVVVNGRSSLVLSMLAIKMYLSIKVIQPKKMSSNKKLSSDKIDCVIKIKEVKRRISLYMRFHL